MAPGDIFRPPTNSALPVPPDTGITPESIDLPRDRSVFDKRSLVLTLACVGLAVVAVLVAQGLQALIACFTNISFFGRFSLTPTPPAGNTLGWWVLLVPVLGGLVVGVMARYGSSAIRGHGIPEAMEQVLSNQSRIHPWMMFLKPVSSAVAIGTGGPFGAEGPIIATGGALGSFFGQLFPSTANERKILLTAGAAAGMTAIFGTPIAAVLLAVELLLFEYKATSIIPVALAAVTAAAGRVALVGTEAAFPMPAVAEPTVTALALYAVIGLVCGVCSVFVTKAVYWIEDQFERLPIHWMWWPALGAVAVGICGYIAPRTLGVGYNNITDILANSIPTQAVLFLCSMKFVSWAISLGSGTSGGTMAPLFTIGSGVGTVCGAVALWLLPNCGIDLRMAALVGMAALFAGATRALLTSVVMAFETTQQPHGLLPLIGGCSAAYVVSSSMMKSTLMTEKIERRGVRVPSDYQADFLDRISVRELNLRYPVILEAKQSLSEVRAWMNAGTPGSEHQGFPVLDNGRLRGVITRRDLFASSIPESSTIESLIRRPPVCIYEDCSLREAADHMVAYDVGRLPVVSRKDPSILLGIITRSDLLAAHKRRLTEHYDEHQVINVRKVWSSLKEET